MSITLYGIPNCDTVKKARKWLEGQGIAHTFFDYKKGGVPMDNLREWVASQGWETILNRRGTTFRKLDEIHRTNLDEEKAIMLMGENPSLIKRPVVEHDGGILVGFHGPTWSTALNG